MNKLEALKINSQITKRGIRLNTRVGAFTLDYPDNIWKAYPEKGKEVLADNLTHLLTINIPFVSDIKKIEYSTSLPFFRSFIYHLIAEGIPSAVDDFSNDTPERLKDFHNIGYNFSDHHIKMPGLKQKAGKKAIIPFSLGKDSLLTTAVAREIGLEPVCIYINDTVSPPENRIKLQFARQLSKNLDIKFYAVKNNIEQLNDFEFWDTKESYLGYMHMIMGFCMIAVPFTYYEKAKYILLGNQQNMNFKFKGSDGFWAYPAPDQRSEWTHLHSAMINTFTKGVSSVYSLIEPLTDIAIIKILHKRYPEFAKYQVSCDCLDASYQKRWCHNCSKCAQTFLYINAFGVKPETVGFHKNLFNKKYQRHYSLFGGSAVEEHECAQQGRDEQLLGFLLATEIGAEGYLIDKFKIKYFKEAKRRKKELIKQFFSLYPAHLPDEISKKTMRIYEKELQKP